jgi:hypothetical protein
MNAKPTAEQIAQEYIDSARAMPDGEFHINSNADGGAAAEDFMRMYAEKHLDEILARRAENGR